MCTHLQDPYLCSSPRHPALEALASGEDQCLGARRLDVWAAATLAGTIPSEIQLRPR